MVLFRREIHLTYTRIQDIHLTSNLIERDRGASMEKGECPLFPYCRAWSRSAMRSSACSMPIESRTSSGGAVEPVPSLVARCSIRLSTHPRDVARTKSLARETAATAASRPPRARNESMPPKARICRVAIACPGCLGSPG